MSKLCEVQSRIHPGVSTSIADQQQNAQPVWSTKQNTSKGVYISIADQQQNVQTMWGTEQNASKVVHKYCRSTKECPTHVKYRAEYIQRCLYKYCRSTTECPTHVKNRAECIQGCPQVVQINIRMSIPCEVQSRMHPRVSTSIADQQRNVQPMCSTVRNTSKGVHKYCRSTTECPNYVRYRAECIQMCPHVLQINNGMSNPCEVQSRMHPKVSTSIADQQRNVQPMCSTVRNTSKGVHKYCRSTTECPNYVRYRAECIQMCPHVLQINNGMSNPCEVQSRIHSMMFTSIADQQQNVQTMWSTEQNASKGVHKCCGSTSECPTHVKYRAECIQGCPQVLQINNGMSNPCEVQCGIHPRVSTSIADQQQNVQTMWGTEQNASKCVHMYCRSTTECPTHVRYRAECIQRCPQVLQINNRMSKLCEVYSRMHPNVSTCIANQLRNVQPMWSTERNTSKDVHKYCGSTTECSIHVRYRAECIQGCPQVLQINNRMSNPCEVQSRMHPRVSTSSADQHQNVHPMWSTEQNSFNDVHKYCRSTTECPNYVKYRAECIQWCPQVLRINNRMSKLCEV